MPTQEQPEEKHQRWCKLLKHLRKSGVNDVPHELLEVPEPKMETRPNVRLVAYYREITQRSLGTLTPMNLLTITFQVLAFYWLINGAVDFAVDGTVEGRGWMANLLSALADLIPPLVGLIGSAISVWFVLRLMTRAQGPLRLNLKELSLWLPESVRHTPWCDVHSATVPKNRWWCFREARRIRVELNDGVVASLWVVDAGDRDLLVDLMRELILCHRPVNYHPSGGGTDPAAPTA